MMIVNGIRQFGAMDFRYAVNSLSFVTKSQNEKNVWCWNIDLSKVAEDEINHKLSSFPPDDVTHFRNLIKKLVRESIPQQVQEKPASYAATALSNNPADSFNDFIQKLAIKQKQDSTIYTVIGDIIEGYLCKDGSFLFTMLDQHDINRTVQLFVPMTLKKQNLEFAMLNNMRVKVSGTVRFYPSRAEMEMIARSIEVLGVCSREKEYDEYEQSCAPYFRTLDAQRKFTIDTITDIGVITGGSKSSPIQGATDFVSRLPKALKDHIYIEYVRISDIQEIIAALQRLNAKGNCQVIAIVRGGGSAESLACYSEPKLIKAIYESPIPVVTGIGHHSDHLLCERAACFNGETPTGAAHYITQQYYRQYYRRYDQQRNHYHAKTEYERILANASKEDLFIENESLKTELEMTRQENQMLQQKLDKIKHRSLISRIFNLG